MTDQRCVDKVCTDGPTDDPAQQQPRWAARGLLCPRCAGLLEQRLAELQARRDLLRANLGGSRSGSSSERRGTPEGLPVPLDLGAHDHLQHLQAVVVSWVRLVAEERGLRGPDQTDVAVLARWLLSQLDWLLWQPWVDDLAEEMREIARTADGLTRVHAGWHSLDAPCPHCDAHELGRLDGETTVGCRACGSSWSEERYRLLVLVLASDQDLSVDARGAAHLLGVKVGTVRQWVARGHLRRAGVVDGQPRYSTAELKAFAERRDATA